MGKAGSRIARRAAVVLIVLALPALAIARGHGPVLDARAIRREVADRAYLRDPLAQIAGWRWLAVADLHRGEQRYVTGRLRTRGDGVTVEAQPGRWRAEPPTLVTSDGQSWAAWLLVGPDGCGRVEWRRTGEGR